MVRLLQIAVALLTRQDFLEFQAAHLSSLVRSSQRREVATWGPWHGHHGGSPYLSVQFSYGPSSSKPSFQVTVSKTLLGVPTFKSRSEATKTFNAEDPDIGDSKFSENCIDVNACQCLSTRPGLELDKQELQQYGHLQSIQL